MSRPVLGQTQSHAPRACKRCSLHKKKCDRLLPRCTGCVQASVPCEAPPQNADLKLIRRCSELRNEVQDLKAQIAHLQRELSSQNGAPDGAQRIATSFDEMPTSSASSNGAITLPLALTANNDHPILSPSTRMAVSPGFVFSSFGLQDYEAITGPEDGDHHQATVWGPPSPEAEAARPVDLSALPTLEEILQIIRSVLTSAKHGPSNLDRILGKTQLEKDCRVVYGPDGLTAAEHAGKRFRCFITAYLAICMTTAINGEDVSADPRAMACREMGMKELSTVTSREDLVCVEALTLLSELAIHEPSSSSLWQLVGLAGRTAITINLHRRDEIYLPTIYPSWPVTNLAPAAVHVQNERRKDLFWALYSLDRLTSFTLSRPSCIKDEDIDVDIPPLTMSPEGKYATPSSEAFWVHHIQARRLFGQISELSYQKSKLADGDSSPQHEKAVSQYAHQVRQWYMWSRFNATVVPFSDDSVKRHVLDDIQYHQMMMALHQPSPLNPSVSMALIAVLKRSASLSVNVIHHAASRKQINVHWINLHHCFTSCAILLYSFHQHKVRPDLVAVPEDEVTEMLARCRDLIPLFRGAGKVLVRRYEAMLSEIIRVFQSQQENPPQAQSLPSITADSQDRSPPLQSNAAEGSQAQANFGKGLTSDIDMIVNSLMQDEQFPTTTPLPMFADVDMSGQLSDFELYNSWPHTMSPGVWDAPAKPQSDVGTSGNGARSAE